jgi:type I restriction enzyme S subunit
MVSNMKIEKYPAYKDSGVEWLSEIPEGWELKKLKRITRFLYGNTLQSENRQEGCIPVFGSNGIVGYHNEAITKAPCVIVGRKGSYGKINYSEKNCFPIDTTYFIDKTATNNNLRWLFYALNTLNLT